MLEQKGVAKGRVRHRDDEDGDEDASELAVKSECDAKFGGGSDDTAGWVPGEIIAESKSKNTFDVRFKAFKKEQVWCVWCAWCVW